MLVKILIGRLSASALQWCHPLLAWPFIFPQHKIGHNILLWHLPEWSISSCLCVIVLIKPPKPEYVHRDLRMQITCPQWSLNVEGGQANYAGISGIICHQLIAEHPPRILRPPQEFCIPCNSLVLLMKTVDFFPCFMSFFVFPAWLLQVFKLLSAAWCDCWNIRGHVFR